MDVGSVSFVDRTHELSPHFFACEKSHKIWVNARSG